MKRMIILFCLLQVTLFAGLNIRQEIVRPENYFKTHPDHEIPKDMVIQHFNVNLTPSITGADYSYSYKLLKATAGSKLTNVSNTGKFGKSPMNTFKAGAFGKNTIGVMVKDASGKVVGKTKVDIFVHFSRVKVAGGDHTKLDPSKGSKKWIAGVFEDDKLVYNGLRFFPSTHKERLDQRYNGGKYGMYEVTEPRVFRNPKTGNLIASYHAKVKGRNDAPPGQTIIVLRSADNGNTWTHDQIIMQDINGFIGYTAFAYVDGEVQCYFTGGHFGHQKARVWNGIYRIVTKDDGKIWSKPELLLDATMLCNKPGFAKWTKSQNIDTSKFTGTELEELQKRYLKEGPIGRNQSLICNALHIPNMTWKGKKGDAILLPFYIKPTKFLISLDGGKSWDMFYDAADYPDLINEMDEISWDLLENRTIYVLSRRKSKSGYKNEFYFDLKGNPTFKGQTQKNHIARRCHHGSTVIPEGKYKNHVMVANHYKVDREDATLALAEDKTATKFPKPRYLTFGAGWGYCDILWNPDTKGFFIIGESEPFDKDEKVIRINKAPTRNERFSIQGFQLSLEFYKTLVEVPKL